MTPSLSPYSGILGQSGCGKTTLARRIAQGGRAAGVGVLALTLPGDAWAEANWQTSDPARFALMFERAERCLCFIEFSDADVDKNDQAFRNMFTKGRHRGHRVFAIAQRHTQIPPIIREQWGQFWLFSCGFSVAKHFADDWGDEGILEAVKYPPHRYLFKRRCLPIQRG